MVVKLRIDSKLSFMYEELKESNPACFKAILRKFKRKNPEYTQLENMGYSTHEVDEYLKAYKARRGRFFLARGCKYDLLKIFKKYKIKFQEFDRTLSFAPVAYPNDMKCAPRDAQPEFMQIVKKHEICIINAYASFGKTLTALMTARMLGQPVIVILHRQLLQKQWKAAITDPTLFNMDAKHIGGCGGIFKKPKLGLINLCLYQSLKKPEILKMFGSACSVVFFDEVQIAPIEPCIDIINRLPAKWKIGMSANYKRKDKKHFVTTWYLGKVAKTFEEKDSSSKILGKLSLVQSNYEDKDYEWDRRAPEMETRATRDKYRNRLVINRCKRKLIMGKIVLLVVSRKYHACRLAKHFTEKGYRTKLILGTINKKKDIPDFAVPSVTKIMLEHKSSNDYEVAKELADKKELDIIVCTHSKAGTGMSISTIDHIVCSSMITGNLEELNQILGREERKYSDQQVEDFGHEKPVPTADFIWDYKIGNKEKHWYPLKQKYGKRIKKVQPKMEVA